MYILHSPSSCAKAGCDVNMSANVGNLRKHLESFRSSGGRQGDKFGLETSLQKHLKDILGAYKISIEVQDEDLILRLTR